MDFVNEQNRGWPGVFEAVRGGREHAAHVGDVGFDAAEPLKFAFGLARDDLGERRFARAGRPEEKSTTGCVASMARAATGRAEDVRLPANSSRWRGRNSRGQRLMAGDSGVVETSGFGSAGVANKSSRAMN